MLRPVAILVLIASFAAPVVAQKATTGPARPAGTGMPVVDAMLDRARTAVADIKLTDEQKTRIDAILDKAGKDLVGMKGDLETMGFRERAQEVRQFFESVRGEIGQALTPEQREQLGQKMEQAGERVRGRPAAPERNRNAAATTAPAGGGAARRPGGPAGEQLVERLRENLKQLDLTDDQKAQLKGIFEDLREKGEALRAEMANAGPDTRQKARELMSETRDKVTAILTPAQREKLRELMGPPPGGGEPEMRDRPRAGGGRGKPGADATMMDGDTMMQDGMTASGASKSKPGSAAESPDKPLPAGPSVGDAAPELGLQKLDGGQVQLTGLKGRVVVLVFGSYSSPSFRNRAAALEKLKTEFGPRAQFVVVYAREAHPAGEWDVSRNKTDGINLEQPKSADTRKAAAQLAREKLKLTTPIALDSIGNDAAIAYGAGANSAYVIDRDGRIAARQQWFEPLALKRALDQATKSPAAGSAGATTKPAA